MYKYDLTGQRFGHLLVLSFSHYNRLRVPMWLCRCDCGTEKAISASNLRRGITISCSCIRARRVSEAKTVHGLSYSPTYNLWHHMIQRCYNPHDKSYFRYGGRGITVCDRWRYDVAAFFADMGSKPPGKSIDRIDNDGPYSPENCRWATVKEQSRNRKTNTVIEYKGKSMPIAAWADLLGFPDYLISTRLLTGWSIERALTTPCGSSRTRKDGSGGIRLLECDGKAQTISQWSRDLGLPISTIDNRVRRGWSVEKALSSPVDVRFRHRSDLA